MIIKHPVFWVVSIVALLAAVWYRGRVYQSPEPIDMSQVVFITGGTGPYWQLTVSGAEAAARDLDVELQVETPADESLAEQTAILSRYETSEQDGIALSPLDAEGQTSLINRFAATTNVVTFDSDAPLSERQCYVGTSNYGAGQLLRQLVREAVPDGGKIAVLLANLTKANLIDRKQGFADSLAAPADGDDQSEVPPEYEVVGYFVDEGKDATCEQIIRDTLRDHPELTCFVGMNAKHGPILLGVLGEEEKLGKVKLVTFDAEDDTLAGIEDGYIFATIAQDPYQYGYEAVRVLSLLHRGAGSFIPIVGKGSILVTAEAIRLDNLDEFRARLAARLEPVDEGA